ncbi:MAG: hypothetical protein IJH07_06850 [Ruminococcus sp.]|nr:hypothetical protein [Ruminococcus sp.]
MAGRLQNAGVRAVSHRRRMTDTAFGEGIEMNRMICAQLSNRFCVIDANEVELDKLYALYISDISC